jgi:hypothetical protein
MIRTQIQLTEQQSSALKGLAALEHVSIAELIRRAIDMTIGRVPVQDTKDLKKRALAVSGVFSSGRSDIAANHDDHLAEIYAQ